MSATTGLRKVTIALRGITPYSQSRILEETRKPREEWMDFEQRVWRDKLNCDNRGIIVIPAMALKQCFDAAAQRLGIQIKGRGKTTYAKFFASDVSPLADASTGIHRDDAVPRTINANADGVRGSGKRVQRIFPEVHRWSAKAEFALLGETIPEAVFEQVVRYSGMSVGIGRFRPAQGGMNGRFLVDGFTWDELSFG